jgi:GNAT superfamily N-acetyltransferase
MTLSLCRGRSAPTLTRRRTTRVFHGKVRSMNVTNYYLEMKGASSLERLAPPENLEVDLRRNRFPLPELNRFLYTAVGAGWYWTERLHWNYAEWLSYLTAHTVETWILYVEGTVAGYFELLKTPEEGAEIKYFGLLPHFTGLGLGKYLLTEAMSKAFLLAGVDDRIWVRTCSTDHPAALENYVKRGMTLIAQYDEFKDVSPLPPGVWEGAHRSEILHYTGITLRVPPEL